MPLPCKVCGTDIPDRPPLLCPACLVESAIDFKRSKPGEHVPIDPQALNELIPEIEIVDIIGQGGMGTVYLGLDANDAVAVKVMAPELGENLELKQRFEREAKILSSLDHPGIVPLRRAGEANDLLYLVMNFIEGQTLRKRPPRSNEAIITLGQSLCEALHYVHGKGIIHRDLKPSNILWDDATGIAKITDFGLAKNHLLASDVTWLTSVNQALGTPRYMAPEQWTGKETTPRSDIYSLGAILYEFLTGTLPVGSFKKPSLVSRSHPNFDAPIMRALATNPSERFATAEEFGIALKIKPTRSKWWLILIPLILSLIFIFWPKNQSKKLAPIEKINVTLIDQAPAASALRSTANQYFGGIQIESDGKHILTGAPCSSENLSISGSGYAVIYQHVNDTLEQIAVLENPFPKKGDRFGYSVTIQDHIAICGAWGDRNQLGSVFVFEKRDTWDLTQTITPPTVNDSGRFGFRVELEENTLVIAGLDQVFIYSRKANTFELAQILKPESTGNHSSFGRSISLDHDQLAIGFMRDHEGSGSAAIYRKQDDLFFIEESLTTSTPTRNSQYGSDIAIHGDWLALAGWRTAKVALFKKTTEGWQEQIILDGMPHTEKGGGFGDSIWLQNNELLIADGSSKEQGAQIFSYRLTNNSWHLESLHRCAPRYHFGTSVMKHHNLILTGSKSNDQGRGGIFLIDSK